MLVISSFFFCNVSVGFRFTFYSVSGSTSVTVSVAVSAPAFVLGLPSQFASSFLFHRLGAGDDKMVNFMHM